MTPTGTLFINPLVQPLSATGTPQALMTASFYVTGTLTPATIYSDAALSTPVTNPATADSTGTFAALYLDPAIVYRCILKTAGGTTVKDIDPITDLANVVLAVVEAAVSPTMLGNWTFAPASGDASLGVDAPSGQAAALALAGNALTGLSGAYLQQDSTGKVRLRNTVAANLAIGTNGADQFQITAAGALQGLGPTAGTMVDMTPDAGTFTGTFTGFTPGSITGTVTWARIGKLVTLVMPVISGTSNATTMTMTGLPAAIQPTTSLTQQGFTSVEDNGVVGAGLYDVANSGTINFFNGFSGGPFTASGTKAVLGGSVIRYMLT